MDTVVVTLRQQNDEIDLELPVAIPFFMLTPILVEELAKKNFELPGSDPANVTAHVINSKTIVRPHETLAQAGVVDGDILELTVARQAMAANTQLPQAKGTYLQCQETGKVFHCRGRAMLIGRLPRHPISLHTLPGSDAVSRTHANLVRRTDGYWIKDERSKNGTIVDGYMLEQGESLRLRPDSLIQFGVDGPTLRFHLAARRR